ncbi:MAG: hypothetical protein DMG68_10240 [Acidobacteria bacterium]|nr:MAG: hypothetical protein DMG68_10240 [Acidobacteriota bacterium]
MVIRTKLLLVLGVMFLAALACAQTVSLPQPPQVQGMDHVVSLTLHAVNANGRDAFAFEGETVAPIIRATPGDVLKITYVNDLPSKSSESCAANPCMDMTNLHFHGLSVSPGSPQDDVLTMLAKPGQVLHYSVEIPRDHSPGLFWYHTHPHGESHRQVLDGMSGAIVVEGMYDGSVSRSSSCVGAPSSMTRMPLNSSTRWKSRRRDAAEKTRKFKNSLP